MPRGMYHDTENGTYLGASDAVSLLATDARFRGSRAIKAFDPKEFLANAGIGRTIHEYRAKQAIFSQGQSSDAVYYIQEGRVRLSVLSKQGKEATIALLGPGDFLGKGCIPSDQPVRLATATAITNSSVLKIHKKEMLRALHAEHLFSDTFVAYMVERHNRTQADLVDRLSGKNSYRSRVGAGRSCYGDGGDSTSTGRNCCGRRYSALEWARCRTTPRSEVC